MNDIEKYTDKIKQILSYVEKKGDELIAAGVEIYGDAIKSAAEDVKSEIDKLKKHIKNSDDKKDS